MLLTLGAMYCSPPLEAHIRAKRDIPSGSSWEIQLRGCSIWCVESIRRYIVRKHPDAQINAILIDFFLYDAIKDLERGAQEDVANEVDKHPAPSRARITEPQKNEGAIDLIPHHRTRSIWY